MSDYFKVVLVTGARQVGKTTMLRRLADGTSWTYVTMDDPLVRDLARKDPVQFLQTYPAPILIDEAQYAPELFPIIKLVADRSQTKGAFWLTASQDYRAMRNVRESLAGRISILRMECLSQAEKAGVPPDALNLEYAAVARRARERAAAWGPEKIWAHIWTGGLPGLLDAQGRPAVWDRYMGSYVDSYLLRDASRLGGVEDQGRFVDFLRACAALVGRQLVWKQLTEAASISQPTARRWLDLLAGLGIVYLLPPFSSNSLKRLSRTPKLYFTDTGLAAWLGRWLTPDTLKNGAAAGAFFENYVVMELRKALSATPGPFSLSCMRDSNGTEIDVILERDGVIHPLEIKKSGAPRSQETRKFAALERAGLRRGAGGIISTAPEPVPISALDSHIPAWII